MRPRSGDRLLNTTQKRFQIGLGAALAIVGLRVGIGWHFYKEGTDKIKGKSFASAAILGDAKGPAAPVLRSFVRDPDGRQRLNSKRTEARWDEFRGQVIKHYGYDKDQIRRIDLARQVRGRQISEFFNENREEIAVYLRGLDRRDAAEADAAMSETPSLAVHVNTIKRDLAGTRAPWLRTIDQIWDGYEADLLAVSTPAQRSAHRAVRMKKAGARWMDTDSMDRVVPWFLAGAGGLLILGLFTRAASTAAALFLLTIIVSQWPGAPGTMPTYYQSVEVLGLLVLVGTAAGRFAGLDYLIQQVIGRRPQKRRPNHEPDA